MNTFYRQTIRSAACSLIISCGLAISLHASATDTSDQRATAHAKRLAFEVCGGCHGAKGVSELPKVPNLAGQDADYLSTQLKAFRDQTRGDPDAVGYMWGMAAALDDDTITALAALYAARPPSIGHVNTPSALPTGRQLYQQGAPDIGVPACSACHGMDGHGMAGFPRLAGQHAHYVLKQLRSFQNNMRDVAVMHGVAQPLTHSQMQSVATYIESLR